jgi:small conductance mechanosensitive channel
MDESISIYFEEAMDVITTYGLDVIGAIVILIAGFIVSGWVRSGIEKSLKRFPRVDDTLRGFAGALGKYAVLAFAVIATLERFGVETTSFIAVLGAAGLAIGLALQGTLSNVAAGVMLLLFRPFKSGDYIDGGGVAGTVKSLTLFTTELATPDNVQIVVPNADLWGTAIKNYSFHKTRRVDFLIGIGYGDDIDKAMGIIRKLADADPRVHADPEPFIVVGELGDSSVNLIVRLWADSPNYWALKFDMTKAIKQAFDAEDITIPFPQRDVHLHEVKD